MRKFLGAVAITAALALGPATAAVAQVDIDPPTTESDSGDDSNAGLWGLLGLAGLAGLMGLKRRDRREEDRSYGTTQSRNR